MQYANARRRRRLTVCFVTNSFYFTAFSVLLFCFVVVIRDTYRSFVLSVLQRSMYDYHTSDAKAEEALFFHTRDVAVYSSQEPT